MDLWPSEWVVFPAVSILTRTNFTSVNIEVNLLEHPSIHWLKWCTYTVPIFIAPSCTYALLKKITDHNVTLNFGTLNFDKRVAQVTWFDPVSTQEQLQGSDCHERKREVIELEGTDINPLASISGKCHVVSTTSYTEVCKLGGFWNGFL